ncbi:DUF6053 domain-containing protein [Lysobacter enzymogenes]|uniref:DUF6053 domain-containing protein n=1 Tax=Lysobacter enzymogenes TaxID=69 RepID=UPI00384EB039
MGGTSVPTLSARIAAAWNESVGTEVGCAAFYCDSSRPKPSSRIAAAYARSISIKRHCACRRAPAPRRATRSGRYSSRLARCAASMMARPASASTPSTSCHGGSGANGAAPGASAASSRRPRSKGQATAMNQ